MTEQFSFETAVQGEAFHPAQQEIAPKGNYVFKVVDVENTRTNSSNRYPMIKLRLECPEGVQWDNLVISPNAFSMEKVLGFTDSVGLPRPVPGQDMDPQDGALTDAYISKAMGKFVGGIVRDETEIDNRPDSPNRGQEVTRPRIKGYRPAGDIANPGASTPAGNGAASPGAAATKAAEEIPF